MTIRELVTRLSFQYNPAGLNQYNQGVVQVKQGTGGMVKAILAANVIQQGITRVAAAGLSWIRDGIIGVTAETERYRVTLGTMIGDQEKANKIIHDLDYSPVSDMFGTAAAIGNLETFVQFGYEAEKASDVLTRLGDVANGNSEFFKYLSYNMGQVFSKGKADAIDLRQFATRGFNVVGEVAKITGQSEEVVAKGGVAYELVEQALVRLTSEGGKYYGMLDKQMDTTIGFFMRFKSLALATAQAIGENIEKPLQEVMRYLLKIGKAIQDTFVEKWTAALTWFIKGFWSIVAYIRMFKVQMARAGTAFDPLRNAVKNAVDWVRDRLEAARPTIIAFAEWFLTAANNISAFLAPIMDEFGKALDKIADFGGKFFEMLTPKNVEESAGEAKRLGEIVSGLVMPFTVAALAIGGFKLALSIKMAVAGFIGGIAAIIKGISLIPTAVGVFKIDFLATMGKIGGAMKGIALAIGGAMKAAGAFLLANPIVLIIAAIIALIIIVILNWKKIKPVVLAVVKAVGDFLKDLWEKIQSIWGGIVEWFSNLWEGIVEAAKNIWSGLVSFFTGLWKIISGIFIGVFDFYKGIVLGVVDAIKNIWNGLISFFTGLWDAIKQGPAATFEYLKTAFTDLIDGLRDKFFGWIDKIREGWESIKDIFGKVVGGAVSFLGLDASAPATAGGAPSYNPYAPSHSVEAAKQRVVGTYNKYAYNNGGNSTVINAPSTMTVNVPPGTTEMQAAAISKQVDKAVQNSLASAINGSRSDIPSPEMRRH
jgi:hypothetical protein